MTRISASSEKEDLRTIKTEKALKDAILSLLEFKKFINITVKDICEKALISRATFYAHFADKYDLLKYCVTYLKPIITDSIHTEDEQPINELIFKNKKVIKNTIYNADDEMLQMFAEVIYSILDPDSKRNEDRHHVEYVVLSNFYAGGLLYYLQWLEKNNFPPDIAPVNIYIREIFKNFRNVDQNE